MKTGKLFNRIITIEQYYNVFRLELYDSVVKTSLSRSPSRCLKKKVSILPGYIYIYIYLQGRNQKKPN